MLIDFTETGDSLSYRQRVSLPLTPQRYGVTGFNDFQVSAGLPAEPVTRRLGNDDLPFFRDSGIGIHQGKMRLTR
jgi:hypothetical protein